MFVDRQSRRFRVRGLVQGVGFRYFTREQAQRLGLAGWVRNLPDSTVEVHAEGPVDALDDFRRALERGPVGARVERVTETEAAEEGAGGFRIAV